MGFEPTVSGSRNRRIARLSYVLNERTQRESNPHVLHGEQARCHYITGAVGPEGLEPSPRWLRARYAAANTWIPVSIGPEGVEPSSGPYKEPALAVELRARLSVGPEGVEPTPYRLKGGYAAVTPRPQGRVGRIGFNG